MGLEIHLPTMSMLWEHEDRPKRKRKYSVLHFMKYPWSGWLLGPVGMGGKRRQAVEAGEWGSHPDGRSLRTRVSWVGRSRREEREKRSIQVKA